MQIKNKSNSSTVKKNIIGICSIPILVMVGWLIAYILQLLFSSLLTDLMKFIKIYTTYHIFYNIANFTLILAIVFIGIQRLNIKLYRKIRFNKWIFNLSTILYSYICVNFLLVFIFYCLSYPFPNWLIR